MNKTKIKVTSVLRLKKKDLGPQIISELKRQLTRRNSEYYILLAMAKNNPQRFHYVPMPSEFIKSYAETNEYLYVPRGTMKIVKSLLTKFGIEYEFDFQWIFFDSLDVKLSDKVTLLSYQKEVITNMAISGQAILQSPCGSGKTVMGVALIGYIKQPTLIVVHTLDLLNQWIDEINDKLDYDSKVGRMGGGVRKPHDITVATIQTLYKLDKNKRTRNNLYKFLSNFGCIIFDECHHIPANSFLTILNTSPSRFRYGLTATPKRKDQKEFLMYDTLGDTIFTVTDLQLKCENRLQDAEIEFVHTDFFSRKSNSEWISLVNDLIQDEKRNMLIADKVKETWIDGHFNLVLSDRVQHVKHLANLFRRRGMTTEVLIGVVPKHIRKSIIERARSNQIDVIVATVVADEGLDIPNLSCIHLTVPTDNESRLQQRIGRIRRPKDMKSLVIDYVDMKVYGFAKKAIKRQKYYQKWNLHIKEPIKRTRHFS